MINLSKKDIEKFELIGQGGFGQIYRKDDKVYKIYREKIKTMMGSVVKNPSLKYNSIKLNRLINLNNKLKKNNLIENLIFINGKFQGVVMPYYEGILLSRTMEKPLEEKIEIAYQIVEKAKELTQNFIYPLDYKLNNIILENNEVKILDLDDYYTKVDLFVNPIHKRKCIRGLDETIKTYFHEFKTFQLPKEIAPNLTKQIEPICSEYKVTD